MDNEQFSARHGATKDLGDSATVKDFWKLIINNDYLDEIVRCTTAYAHPKGDKNFSTRRADITAYTVSRTECLYGNP